MTDIDARLHTDGEAWRSAAEIPDLDALLPSGSGTVARRRRLAPLAAAAVVGVAATGTALLIGHPARHDDAAGPTGTPSVSTSAPTPTSTAPGPTTTAPSTQDATLPGLVLPIPGDGQGTVVVTLTATTVGGLDLGGGGIVASLPEKDGAEKPPNRRMIVLLLAPGTYRPIYRDVVDPAHPAVHDHACSPRTFTVVKGKVIDVDLTC